MFRRTLVSILAAAAPLAAHAYVTVYTVDFISDSVRTGFNGFESAPAQGWYFDGTFPYSEGGISVEQVGDAPSAIWLTCGAAHAAGYCFGVTGAEGQYSWYPNGGDEGYTKITRSNGADFDSVGFLTGNTYTTVGATYLNYTLRNDGATIVSGQILIPKNSPDRGYLGFGGGGFDEIWVSEVSVTGGRNGLAIDSIEIGVSPVPEPASFALFGAGLAVLGLASRRKSLASPAG